MEALYLWCSIISTFFTTLVLSLLLLLSSLLRRCCRSHSFSEPASSVYQGIVWHERRRPVRHSFKYTVGYALIDLDRAARPPPDHLSADHCRSIAQTDGPVFLLTIPPSVGYEQNPLSLYYCYDSEGCTVNLKKCIAEVTNTPWGERVSFLFNPKTDLVAKPLHVSPFMVSLSDCLARLLLIFLCYCFDDTYITGTHGYKMTCLLQMPIVNFSFAADSALFFWLMPHRVAVWIYWHALKLWWKGVPFIQHPRYSHQEYREEALVRDMKLQCCQAFQQDEQNHLRLEGNDSDYVKNGRNRRFSWRDAKWPWA
ncbi:hypothetical protein RHSIM_Rhsim02G0159200 [Rhododendron simsii]|uniref:Uncharacterized protein n=1 Tax=Rhododendron simsii TaxID=118357 RepID=A0A834LTF9_RHOSS|nr:hypothetical protein RHSIM_Rhsim02G0159200 [Rhododendron simsii]